MADTLTWLHHYHWDGPGPLRVHQTAQVSDIHLRGGVSETTSKALGRKFKL